MSEQLTESENLHLNDILLIFDEGMELEIDSIENCYEKFESYGREYLDSDRKEWRNFCLTMGGIYYDLTKKHQSNVENIKKFKKLYEKHFPELIGDINYFESEAMDKPIGSISTTRRLLKLAHFHKTLDINEFLVKDC